MVGPTQLSPISQAMQSLQQEIRKIESGVLTPRESQAHDYASQLLTNAKALKREIIDSVPITGKFKAKTFLEDPNREVPISRAIALTGMVGHSSIQYDDELKRILSMTASIFWELVGLQSMSQRRRTYRKDVKTLNEIVRDIFTTLPSREVETRFALNCSVACAKVFLTAGKGAVKETFNDSALPIFKGILEAAFSRNPAPLVGPVLDLMMNVGKKFGGRWFIYTCPLNWTKAITTVPEFDETTKLLKGAKGKTKAYLAFVNIISDILSESSPSSSSSPPSPDLRAYVFNGHEKFSLVKLARLNRRLINHRWFDKYWETRRLSYLTMERLIEKQHLEKRNCAEVVKKAFSDEETNPHVADAALQVLMRFPPEEISQQSDIAILPDPEQLKQNEAAIHSNIQKKTAEKSKKTRERGTTRHKRKGLSSTAQQVQERPLTEAQLTAISEANVKRPQLNERLCQLEEELTRLRSLPQTTENLESIGTVQDQIEEVKYELEHLPTEASYRGTGSAQSTSTNSADEHPGLSAEDLKKQEEALVQEEKQIAEEEKLIADEIEQDEEQMELIRIKLAALEYLGIKGSLASSSNSAAPEINE